MLEVSFVGWGNCWYVRIPYVHVHKQNIIKFDDEVNGVFLLSPEDEEEYLRTKSFYHVKTMRPCLSPGSTFLKLVEEGKIHKIDAEYCYFEVKRYKEVYAPIPRINVEVEVLNVFTVIEPDQGNASPSKRDEMSKFKGNGIAPNKLVETIFGMAMDKYGHNPDNPQNNVYTSINKVLRSLMISVEIDDIKKSLSHGFNINKKRGNSKFYRETTVTDIRLDELLKMFLGMAIDAYGFDPIKNGKQNATGKGRESISYRIGKHATRSVLIDYGTVKKYLDEAKLLLPIQSQQRRQR